MELLQQFIDITLHIDKHLNYVFENYGTLIYVIMFIIIFCETGFVVTPFLPGDSLLFALGALTAVTGISLPVLLILLPVAAISGDNTNYWIGHWVGPKIFSKEDARFFSKKNLDRAHNFYDKYGAIAVSICRFAPILRTFVPFVSGIVRMKYTKFLFFSILGGISWTYLLVLAGYYFGNIEIVKKNFEIVILSIIVISLMPVIIEAIRSKFNKN